MWDKGVTHFAPPGMNDGCLLWGGGGGRWGTRRRRGTGHGVTSIGGREKERIILPPWSGWLEEGGREVGRERQDWRKDGGVKAERETWRTGLGK